MVKAVSTVEVENIVAMANAKGRVIVEVERSITQAVAGASFHRFRYLQGAA